MTNSPMPAPTLSTATIVLTPGRNFVGSFSSTSCGRTQQQLATVHGRVLLGRDDRTFDSGKEHKRET